MPTCAGAIGITVSHCFSVSAVSPSLHSISAVCLCGVSAASPPCLGSARPRRTCVHNGMVNVSGARARLGHQRSRPSPPDGTAGMCEPRVDYGGPERTTEDQGRTKSGWKSDLTIRGITCTEAKSAVGFKCDQFYNRQIHKYSGPQTDSETDRRRWAEVSRGGPNCHMLQSH